MSEQQFVDYLKCAIPPNYLNELEQPAVSGLAQGSEFNVLLSREAFEFLLTKYPEIRTDLENKNIAWTARNQ